MSHFLFDPFSEEDFYQPVRLVIKNFNTFEFFLVKVLKLNESININYFEFEAHWNYKYKYQVKNELGKWEDTGYYKWLMPENKNEDGLKYLLYEEPDSEYLLVVFQAVNTRPTYNYISTVKDFKINKLFIKDDYGKDERTRSSYYLGTNKNLDIAKATQNLITKVSQRININKSDTIFMGSSKGGFSAIYHGYRYGVGTVIAGGPPILLGNNLNVDENRKPIQAGIFKSLIGEMNEENVKWANNLIVDSLQHAASPYPKTYIHVGYWEPNYENHVTEFMKITNELNINNIELNVKDYHTHKELAKYFPPYIKETLNKIINND